MTVTQYFVCPTDSGMATRTKVIWLGADRSPSQGRLVERYARETRGSCTEPGWKNGVDWPEKWVGRGSLGKAVDGPCQCSGDNANFVDVSPTQEKSACRP